MKTFKRFFKVMYHKWTHRKLNVETPLKTMTVLYFYDDETHGKMVRLMWKHDDKIEYGAVRVGPNSTLKEGTTVQVQTYKYLEKKVS